MKKVQLIFCVSAACLLLGMISCGDDDSNDTPGPVPIDKGDVVANRYILTFTDLADTMSKPSFEYYDPDGIGGAPATVVDTIELRKGRVYSSRIEFFQDNDMVTVQIENTGTKYIVCYRNFDAVHELWKRGSNENSNGKDLGTETSWEVRNDVAGDDQGEIRVTLNYQAAFKEGLCDAGVRITEGSLPYKLN